MTPVFISTVEIERCQKFAEAVADGQIAIEFNERHTLTRGRAEVIRDAMIGRLGELAVAKMLRYRFKIEAEPDWTITDRGIGDDGDLLVMGRRVDVKATRAGGRWLLVERTRFEIGKRLGKLSDFYVLASTGWNRQTDKPTGVVNLVGYAKLTDLCQPSLIGERGPRIAGLAARWIGRGDFLPDTQVKLQTDNLAIPHNLLRKDWWAFVLDCREMRPQ